MLLFPSLNEGMVSKVGLINNVQFKYLSLKNYGHTRTGTSYPSKAQEKQKLLALPEHLTSPQIFNMAFSTH
jgi:hypothetical protein